MAIFSSEIGDGLKDIFFDELQRRTSHLPFKSSRGKSCVSINMSHCSYDFILCVDEYLDKNKNALNVLVTGEEYYLEILSSDIFQDVINRQ